MLKAYDISASWPKAVEPGGTGIPPVVSGILPETGAPPALVPAASRFTLAVARQFPGGRPLGGRPQGPESGPVRPGQTFEILKIAGHGSDHSGAVFSFSIFHFPFKPVAVRQDRENGQKTLVALPLNSGPSTVGQAQSDSVRLLKFFKNRPAAQGASVVRKNRSPDDRGGRPPGPESDPVRPSQTFEFLKNRRPRRRQLPGRFFYFLFSIFHLNRRPAQRRHRILFSLIPPTPAGEAEKWAKDARGFTVKYKPIKVNQAASIQSGVLTHHVSSK